MPLICLLLTLTISLDPFCDLDQSLVKLAAWTQNVCVSTTPANSNFRNLYSAIVCGQNVTIASSVSQFKTTGLFHLLVVSGAHLTWLSTIIQILLRRIPKNATLIGAFLLAFTFFAGAQPPLVRSLFHLLARKISVLAKLHWSPFDTLLFSGVITLLIFPDWVTSLSFWLSWLASLATLFASSFFQSPWLQLLSIHVVFLPALSAFGSTHPMTLVFNFLLAPILGGILLPMSLLTCLFNPLSFLGDGVWKLFLFFLNLGDSILPFHSGIPHPQTLLLFTLASQNVFHLIWILWRRSKS